jgi:hypothetical protein
VAPSSRAKLNNVDPQAWLADVLRRIAGHPASRLVALGRITNCRNAARGVWQQSRTNRPLMPPHALRGLGRMNTNQVDLGAALRT